MARLVTNETCVNLSCRICHNNVEIGRRDDSFYYLKQTNYNEMEDENAKSAQQRNLIKTRVMWLRARDALIERQKL